MENIFEDISDYIVVVNESKIIKFCNKKFVEKLKYKKEEIIGRNLEEDLLYNSKLLWNIKHSYKVLNENDNIYSFKSKENCIESFIGKVYKTKWNNEEAYLMRFDPKKYDDKEKSDNIINDLDRDLKLAINKYEGAEAKISMLLNTTIDLLGFLDEQGRILRVNQEWQKCLGWTDEDLKNIKWQDLFHPDEKNQVIAMARASKKEGEICEGTNRCRCKNGEYKIIYWKGIYINKWGIFVGSGSDITEEKKYESESKKYEEAFHAELIKNEFFTNMSHEFKTPLNIIFSALQLIEHGIKNNQIISVDSFNLDKYINSIKQNSYRLLRLVTNIIDASEFDMGYYNLNMKNCNIVYLVEDMVTSVISYVEGKNIEITFDTEVEEIMLACDQEKIERIVLNLISNAIKYTSKDNTKVGKIDVSLSIDNGYVLISIKDNGIGISQEEIGIIFNRFKRINNKLNRMTEGSGIGLALVKSLVEMHDGEIKVKSEIGQGAEFIFSIPIRTVNEYSMEHREMIKSTKIERCTVEFSDIYEF
ncbi:ATP-binding protein [Clostridium sp. 1001271B_151109_B4]|uniref:sensor histidine kinase n=1 Tax=Clostridium sp. 1001271B_151109_B4 TaxID=2787148 RepID=UPI0018ABEA4D|nr:ATP-binding protein [Clostridium sp. 1001271B_151109_B4]